MLGNYLITEDTTMKAFKKLMAAALVCVMALTMLTGCAVGDNIAEKKLVDMLNDKGHASYTHKTDLDDEAEKAYDAHKGAESNGQIVLNKVVYNYVIVKKPDSDNRADKANTIDKALAKTSVKNKDSKIEIGVKVVGSDNNYIAVVAKALDQSAAK